MGPLSAVLGEPLLIRCAENPAARRLMLKARPARPQVIAAH